jgi:hypothetical protein
MTVQFSPVRFLLVQTGNCVSPRSLNQTQAAHLLGPEASGRLLPALRTVDPAILKAGSH